MDVARSALILAGLLGLSSMTTLYSQPATPVKPEPPAVAAVPPPDEPELKRPEIKWQPLDHSYNVLRGSFTLINPNKVPLKDIVLECDTRGASGTVIRQQRFTVYQSIPANGKRFVKYFTFGFWPPQGAQFACSASLK